jgi:MerR family transcriptional regulator, copper efflux regulator
MAMERVRHVFADRLRETREQIVRLTQLERDLDASLAYLEGCRSCEPKEHQIQECPSCNHNGHEEGAQPILVAGIHRG